VGGDRLQGAQSVFEDLLCRSTCLEFGRMFGAKGKGFPPEVGRTSGFLDTVPPGESVRSCDGRVAFVRGECKPVHSPTGPHVPVVGLLVFPPR